MEEQSNPEGAGTGAAGTATETAPAEVAKAGDAAAATPSGKRADAAPAKKKDEAPNTKDDPFVKLAGEYSKLYPASRAFHITTDRQVFLERDKHLAELHQRGLDGGAVVSITPKRD